MKYILFFILIKLVSSQNGNNTNSSSTNGTTSTVAPTTTTTTLRGVTTTVANIPTEGGSVTTTTPTTKIIEKATTTPWPMVNTTTEPVTTTVPYCDSNTSYNGTCKVCLGPLCKFVENGEQGVGWEILFVAAFLTFSGLACLTLYYVCLRPILNNNIAEDIHWTDDSDSDDEDWHETATLMTSEQIRRKSSKELEIIDLNPIKRDE
tara:strand:- start:552 stop:1169 length:618 start_codon:yes stop_codon:yes gene_type:complete